MKKTTLLKLVTSLLFLATVAIVVSCQPAQEGNIFTSRRTIPVEILTFNIRYGLANDGINRWQNRNQFVFQTIEEIDPDFIGLQEALRFQIDEIKEALPMYGEIGVGRDDGKTEGEYSAILFKKSKFSIINTETFWFSDTPNTPGTADWGNTIPRICTWGYFTDISTGARFYIYNIHLDHQSQPSREKSTMALAENIARRETKDPFVITGDFNAGEGNQAILYLEGKTESGESMNQKTPVPVKDSFRDLHPDATNVGTFNAFEGLTDGPKIDYVFVPQDMQVLEAEIIQRSFDMLYPSDHFPVLARVAIPVGLDER